MKKTEFIKWLQALKERKVGISQSLWEETIDELTEIFDRDFAPKQKDEPKE